MKNTFNKIILRTLQFICSCLFRANMRVAFWTSDFIRYQVRLDRRIRELNEARESNKPIIHIISMANVRTPLEVLKDPPKFNPPPVDLKNSKKDFFIN